MKKTIYPILIVFVFLLAACGTAGTEPAVVEPEIVQSVANDEPDDSNTGMGMMGMGGSMMDRHHATIPEEYAGLTNRIPADEASIERGAELYATHCATCHGDGGLGDGPGGEGLDPAPANIAHTSQMLGDDYQYWRISEGGAMEPFNSSMIAWKGVLDEDARWDVINYVQALGSGAVMPMEHMGGAAFDPEAELEQRTAMLADAVEQDVITQAEADTFAEVHAGVDDHMAEMGDQQNGGHDMGGMDDMLPIMLSELVGGGKITQAQADTFMDVHDRLHAAGLMQ
jgi:mono/diheme cytochrome c family protein